jgi:hypothetical protein
LVGLPSVAEHILRESLDPGQPNQAIGFFHGERLLAFSSIATSAGRDDKSLDLSVGKAAALHSGNRALRDARENHLRKIRLRHDFSAEDFPASELPIDGI